MIAKPIQTAIDIIVPLARILRTANLQPPQLRPSAIFRAIVRTFLFVWLASFTPIIGTLLYSILFVPLAATLHIQQKAITDKTDKAHIYLLYFVVITIGFGGLWGFIGHTVRADYVAAAIGWPTGSPFQTELAFYHLGFAFAALLAIFIRDHLITALVIAKSIFWFGAAYVHLKDAYLSSNFSPLNIGAPLIGDIVLPVIMLWLLWVSLQKT